MHNKENLPPHNLFHNPLISNLIKTKAKLCPQHSHPLGNLFCVDCLSYSLCSECAYQLHQNHEIMRFNDEEEAKAETREILLETLEETLKQLKSKENEMKNRTSELKVIRHNLQGLEKEIMTSLSNMFRQIEEQLANFIKAEEEKYEREVDTFYEHYNRINDELRDNLMKIIDGDIEVEHFTRSMVVMKAPDFPNFQKYKSGLEKAKKTYKQLKNYIEEIEGKVKEKENKGMGMKLEKYIESRSSGAYDKVNEPFMGMLRLMDQKENVPTLNLRRSGK